MKEWTHEELHKLMENDPEIKLRSDEIHAIPETDDLIQREQNKMLLMKIYADAIGCKKGEESKQVIADIFGLIKREFTTWSEWQSSSATQHFEEIVRICEPYQEKKICHSPKGNNYVCYCHDLT